MIKAEIKISGKKTNIGKDVLWKTDAELIRKLKCEECGAPTLLFFVRLTGLDQMYMILVTAVITIGILVNVFIGLVNCSDWIRNQKFTFNFILMCLALSRISCLLVLFTDATMLVVAPHVYDSYILTKCIDIFWVVTDQLSTWFATCLSIFYLLKIAHFSHPHFLWLKWRMRRVVAVFLLFSLFSLILYFLLFETIPILRSVYRITKSNMTLFSDTSKAIAVKKLIIFDVLYLVPFLVSLVSFFLLFLSLVKHSRNFNIISTSSKDSTAKVHKKALKILLSFLILFIIHIFSTQVARWLFIYFQKNRSSNFVLLTLIVFPSSHSFILILGNSKLRQTTMSALQHLKSQLQEMVLSLYRFSSLY